MFTLRDRDFDWPLLRRQPDRLDRWAVALVLVAAVLGTALALIS